MVMARISKEILALTMVGNLLRALFIKLILNVGEDHLAFDSLFCHGLTVDPFPADVEFDVENGLAFVAPLKSLDSSLAGIDDATTTAIRINPQGVENLHFDRDPDIADVATILDPMFTSRSPVGDPVYLGPGDQTQHGWFGNFERQMISSDALDYTPLDPKATETSSLTPKEPSNISIPKHHQCNTCGKAFCRRGDLK